MKIYLLLMAFILFFGCVMFTTKISDINSNYDKYLGKEVTVQGTVSNSLKIGSISGYVVRDSSGSIRVSSDTLPTEGKDIIVRGTLVHDTLFGYYLLKTN